METILLSSLDELLLPVGYTVELLDLVVDEMPLIFYKDGKKSYELAVIIEHDCCFITEPTAEKSRYEFIEPSVNWIRRITMNYRQLLKLQSP